MGHSGPAAEAKEFSANTISVRTTSVLRNSTLLFLFGFALTNGDILIAFNIVAAIFFDTAATLAYGRVGYPLGSGRGIASSQTLHVQVVRGRRAEETGLLVRSLLTSKVHISLYFYGQDSGLP
jgi:hypothetical protein